MKIKDTEVWGFRKAIIGCRNPKNSWGRMDSTCEYKENSENINIGENDLKLLQNLLRSGSAEEYKYMRMIHVWADLDMTRFFWSEMDTYHFNTKNSCSTMHKLLNPKNEITLDMFDYYKEDEDVVKLTVNRLNEIRKEFLISKGEKQRILKRRAKCLLMEGFLQMRTIDTNYAEIRNIVKQRCRHQMKEDWVETFCKWATTLPYAKELIFYGMEEVFDKIKNL